MGGKAMRAMEGRCLAVLKEASLSDLFTIVNRGMNLKKEIFSSSSLSQSKEKGLR